MKLKLIFEDQEQKIRLEPEDTEEKLLLNVVANKDRGLILHGANVFPHPNNWQTEYVEILLVKDLIPNPSPKER